MKHLAWIAIALRGGAFIHTRWCGDITAFVHVTNRLAVYFKAFTSQSMLSWKICLVHAFCLQ
jgi:hypothetical protein